MSTTKSRRRPKPAKRTIAEVLQQLAEKFDEALVARAWTNDEKTDSVGNLFGVLVQEVRRIADLIEANTPERKRPKTSPFDKKGP